MEMGGVLWMYVWMYVVFGIRLRGVVAWVLVPTCTAENEEEIEEEEEEEWDLGARRHFGHWRNWFGLVWFGLVWFGLVW